MDKNTITGIILIGVVIVAFSFFGRPNQEQIALQQQYADSIAQVQAENMQKAEAERRAREDAQIAQVAAIDTASIYYASTQGTTQKVSLENDFLKLDFSTQGGTLVEATIKKYNGMNGKPVRILSPEDSRLGFTLYNGKETIHTNDLFFTPVNATSSSLTMRLAVDSESYIDFIYRLGKDSYMLDFDIQAVNMQGKLSPSVQSIDIDWRDKARQIEKGYDFENRYSNLTWRTTDNESDDITATNQPVTENVALNIDWIAFKNQFFSAVMIANQSFMRNGELTTIPMAEGSGYLKEYKAKVKAFFDPTGAKKTSLQLYIGPNDYSILNNLPSQLEDGRELDMQQLISLGWLLFRWINRFLIIPMFDILSGLGLNMGIVLLILTLIVKVIIFPFTFKSYMSSAKMRVLKPQISKINEKYPKKEDAMKKQQETMTLYRKYGVSPMGGCLPMLIQFPVYIALFMFVPSAIQLRGESFLWATDLSAYDDVISWGTHLPLIGDHMSLFCLLFCITNILNTHFTMKQQDTGQQQQLPAMKWMMYLMPLMFIFILNNYAAGLNYYYFISTLISILTMVILKRTINDDKILARLEANKKESVQVKKSGFMARMEAMQREQERIAQEKAKRKQ